MAEARKRIGDVEDPFGQTYGWVFGSSIKFTTWLQDSAAPYFWIQGKPGSGKSTMMKYILGQYRTASLLPRISATGWVIAGFFFHDRGSASQKTVESLLREILYQTLKDRDDLVRIIARIFMEKLVPWPLELEDGTRWTSRDLTDAYANLKKAREVRWSPKDIVRAFELINNQPEAVNLCLFIDALDEHSGNPRELLQFFDQLTRPRNAGSLNVKMCVASRPENVFHDAFHAYPGFAIHDHTAQDIRQYATRRLRNINLAEDGLVASDLGVLVPDILHKAQGVFIWVRLVIEELVEGLCDGDTVEELQQILVTIPTELGDLYHRALLRYKTRRNTYAPSQKHQLEAHIMLQIAACAYHPYNLTEFSRAVAVLAGQPAGRGRTRDEMRRRLRARTGGLLETMGHPDPEYERVQFLHQTAKEFILRDVRATCLSDGSGGSAFEGGHVLLQRYCISLFGASDFRCTEAFAEHAYQADVATAHGCSADLEKLVQLGTDRFHRLISKLEIGWHMGEVLKGTQSAKLQLIVMAVGLNLTRYLKKQIVDRDADLQMYCPRVATALAWAAASPRYNSRAGLDQVLVLLCQQEWARPELWGNPPLQNLLMKYQLGHYPTRSKSGYLYTIDSELETVKALLEQTTTADPNRGVKWGGGSVSPPLVLAVTNELAKIRTDFPKMGMVDTLLSHGADPNIADAPLGNKVLFYAIEQNDVGLVQRLISYGADLRSLNIRGLDFWDLKEADYGGSGRSFDGFVRSCDGIRTRLVAEFGYVPPSGPREDDTSSAKARGSGSGFRNSAQSVLSVFSTRRGE